MTQRAIVLDANILIRAVLGQRVRQLITDHAANVLFLLLRRPMQRRVSTSPGCLRNAG